MDGLFELSPVILTEDGNARFIVKAPLSHVKRNVGKEQILKRWSKYAGCFFFVFSPFSITSPPVCLSPSLVVSTICHPQLHQRLGFQNGAFLSAFVPWFFKKKRKRKTFSHLRREICGETRSGGRRVAICTSTPKKNHLHLARKLRVDIHCILFTTTARI